MRETHRFSRWMKRSPAESVRFPHGGTSVLLAFLRGHCSSQVAVFSCISSDGQRFRPYRALMGVREHVGHGWCLTAAGPTCLGSSR